MPVNISQYFARRLRYENTQANDINMWPKQWYLNQYRKTYSQYYLLNQKN